MADTTILVTRSKEEAEKFAFVHTQVGEKVIRIFATDRVRILKDSQEKALWGSGPAEDWIVLIATPDAFETH